MNILAKTLLQGADGCSCVRVCRFGIVYISDVRMNNYSKTLLQGADVCSCVRVYRFGIVYISDV